MGESLGKKSEFGLVTGYIFTINCIIGTGFLSVPYAFDSSGLIFCLIYQVFVGFQAYLMARMLLESMSRAEVLMRMAENGRKIHYVPFSKYFNRPKTESLLDGPTDYNPIITDTPSPYTPTITHRVITVPEVMKLAFGERFGIVYFYLSYFGFIGVLIAYCSIFSTSFASNVPLGDEETCDLYSTSGFYNDCRAKYWIYLLIFCVITCLLTIAGIKEQRSFQVSMSIMRFVVIFLVIGTCLADISTHRNNEDDGYNDLNTPTLFNPKNIGHSIPIIIFASGFHFQIPTLFESVGNKARNLPLICLFVSITVTVFYSVLGIIVPLAINGLESMASLAYKDYSAGYAQSNRPAWTYMVEYIIIICPAIDVLSGFPLNALTFADVVVSQTYKNRKPPMSGVYLIRFIIAFIPSIIAFFIYDLSFIFDWSGLILFLPFSDAYRCRTLY